MKSERMFLITFVMLLVITSVALIFPDFNIDISITGQVASGSLPTIGGDSGNWGSILNTYLTQEHTSTGGHKNVTTQGDIVDSSGGIISIPSGFIGMFNSTNCPTGWNEMTESRGRYLVGLPSNGTLGATVGTNLTDQENRAVGNHSHEITDPEHNHSPVGGDSFFWDRAEPGATGTVTLTFGGGTVDIIRGTTANASTGITVNNTGNVNGTNAPYIQVLVCIKT